MLDLPPAEFRTDRRMGPIRSLAKGEEESTTEESLNRILPERLGQWVEAGTAWFECFWGE